MFDILSFFLLTWPVSGQVEPPDFRCDYTFERGSGWYKFVLIPTTYDEAAVRCYGEGAILASPLNKNMLKIMMNHMKDYDLAEAGIYTGLRARLGDFVSIEGVNLDTIEAVKWDKDQPDNLHGSEDCVNLKTNGKLNDVPCSKISSFMCFRRYKQVPWNKDCGTTDPEYALFQRYSMSLGYVWNRYWATYKTEPCTKIHKRKVAFKEAFRICALEGGRLLHPDWTQGNYSSKFLSYYGYYKLLKTSPYIAWIAVASEYFTFENGLYSYMDGKHLECYGQIYSRYIPNYFNDFYDYDSEPDYYNPKFCITLQARASKTKLPIVVLKSEFCNSSREFLCEKSSASLTNCDPYINNPEIVTAKPKIDLDTRFRCDYTYYEDGQGWYKLHQVPTTFGEAVRICHMEGAKMAAPLYKNRTNILLALMHEKEVEEPGIWAGIHATIAKGLFHTVDGGWPLYKIKHEWDEEQPDNIDGNQECLTFRLNGLFADEFCDDIYPYICYKKFEKLPPIGKCGTTDKDYATIDSLGHCYKINTIPRLWHHAKISCTAEGGYLAIVNNSTEHILIRQLAASTDTGLMATRGTYSAVSYRLVYSIGFYKNMTGIRKPEWRTIYGQLLKEAGYDKTYKIPYPVDKSGECGQVVPDKYDYLYYGSCSTLRKYICEKDPKTLVACYIPPPSSSDEDIDDGE